MGEAQGKGGSPLRSDTTGPLTLLPQLQRKMEERRLRLQEAANRCIPFLSDRHSGRPGKGFLSP